MGRISGRIRTAGSVGGNIRRPETVYVKELYFANRYEFPSIGEENKLYIAKDENTEYWFDIDEMVYKPLGLQASDIKQINGGNAYGQ